jgi:hypothetical protein
MKGGINIWRALRNNHTMHPAWVHLADSPITEADLPRSIQAAAIPVSSDTSGSTSKPDSGKLVPAIHVAATAEGSQPSCGLAASKGAVAVVGSSVVMQAGHVESDDSNEPDFVL